MARFYGAIGFEKDQIETSPGIYNPSKIIERSYLGNVLKHLRKWESSADGPNDDLKLANRISIVCDAYMTDHWPAIKYVDWCGKKWKVESVEVAFPRIILTLGGPWNGQQASAT